MNRLRNAFFCLAVFGILSSVAAWASRPQISVQVRPPNPRVGQVFQLEIKVSSEEESFDVDDVQLPPLSAFEILNSYRSHSSSSHLTQGTRGMEFRTVRSFIWGFQVRALKKGQFKIDPIRVMINGQSQKVDPVLILVTEGGLSSPSQDESDDNVATAEEDELDQLFNQLLRKHGLSFPRIPQLPSGSEESLPQMPLKRPIPPEKLNDAFFVHLDVDKTEVYVGEQITAQWYLYTRGQMLSLDRLKFPDLKGFWKEIIEEIPALNFTTEMIKGYPYRKALLAAHALFPINPGQAVIDEYKIRATVQLPRLGLGSFGFGEPYAYEKSSDRLVIRVKPLPPNEPKNFTGAVGEFEVSVGGPQGSVTVGRPFSIKVRFEGRGNAKFIELPELNLPQGIGFISQKSEAKFFKNGFSVKDYELVFSAEAPGDYLLPAMEFVFFNPVSHEFYRRTTEPVALKVIGGGSLIAKNENGGKALGSESDVTHSQENQANQLPPLIHRNLNGFQMAHLEGVFQMLIFVGWLIFIVWLIARIYRDFFQNPSQRLWQEYIKWQLSKIQKRMKKGDPAEVAVLMVQALSKLVGAASRLGDNSQEFSRLLSFAPPSLQKEVGSEIQDLYQVLTEQAFAPKDRRTLVDPEKLYQRFKAVSNRIIEYLDVA
ncbi:MAG: BatD family protein [Bdellovibrionaceae bacterium]|nr:BatD family protein [Pseudobdellovibrionaceae bacterium]MDW8189619.1 BatD family protein [Pseudobdellovibrionaceae bacterium]